MPLTLYQVDAFTDRMLSGNPAAVCPLDSWLDEDLMQALAAENNLSETAFFVAEGAGYGLRWFTPLAEVPLCGHATLATAHVMFNHLGVTSDRLVFSTKSGDLMVTRQGERLAMDFPSTPVEAVPTPPGLADALGDTPDEVVASNRDYIAVFSDEARVRRLRPDFGRIAAFAPRRVVATAAGDGADFVSRFFAPSLGINEDPVNGSSHCALTPLWASRLGKKDLHAVQASARGGTLHCTDRGARVTIAGQAVTYMVGTIELGDGA